VVFNMAFSFVARGVGCTFFCYWKHQGRVDLSPDQRGQPKRLRFSDAGWRLNRSDTHTGAK
jgi:hypothetical protein